LDVEGFVLVLLRLDGLGNSIEEELLDWSVFQDCLHDQVSGALNLNGST
jgi:hypothetical protein